MAGVCGGDSGSDASGFGLVANSELFGLFGHLGGAFQLVPVEGLAVDGAFDGLEQDNGEKLAVGESLDPDVEEEPAIAFAGRMLALEGEGECGGGEVDYEKRQ